MDSRWETNYTAPYPGLRPFRRDEAELFFGREEQVDQLLAKLQDSRFVAVVGFSGCGKSSLVRAGMLPALDSGFIADAGARWHVALMRPGSHPLANLSTALVESDCLTAHWQEHPHPQTAIEATLRRGPLGLVDLVEEADLPEQANLLIVVDQFEEIFRFHEQGDSNEARAFVDMLLASASQSEARIYVVITMRSDFLGDCAVFAGLPEALNDGQYLTPRLTRDQCRAAVVGPAAIFGGEVEPPLVDRILNDIGTDPDQLPLMQHALLRVWRRAVQRGSQDASGMLDVAAMGGNDDHAAALRLSDYENIGGLTRALSNHADEAFEELSEDDRWVAEVMFRCLSERGPDQRDTRRPILLDVVAQVADVTIDRVASVVEVFRRTGRSFLTPPVGVPLEPGAVLDISHESLIRQWERLSDWVEEEAASAEMYVRLHDTAVLWKDGKAALWSTPDLENALEWRKREQPTAAWAERYRGEFALSMEFLDASVTESERRKKEEADRQQIELELTRQIAETAKRRADEADQRRREQAAANRGLRTRALVATAASVVAISLAVVALILYFSANRAERREVVAREKAEQARKQSEDHATNAIEQEKLAQRTLGRLYFSNGMGLLHDHDELGAAVWFAEALKLVQDDPQRKEIYHTQLAAALARCPKLVQVFLHDQPLKQAGFSPDGRYIFALDEGPGVRIWDVVSGEQTTSARNSNVRRAEFSPDSKRLLTMSTDGTARLWSTSTSEPVGSPLPPEQAIHQATFSPDGKVIAITGSNGNAQLLDAETSEPISTMRHPIEVTLVAFAPGGQRLVSACADSTIRLWEPTSGNLLSRPHPHTVPKSSDDKDNAKPEKQLEQVTQSPTASGGSVVVEQLTHLVFAPDRSNFLTASENGTLVLWKYDAVGNDDSLERVKSLLVSAGPLRQVEYSADGEQILTVGSEGQVKLWSSIDGASATLPSIRHHDEVTHATFSPDGRLLATASKDETARLWDLEDDRPASPVLQHHESVSHIAFDPHGRFVLTANADKTVRVWDTDSSEAILRHLDHGSDLTDAKFAPDFQSVITVGQDGTKAWSTSDPNAEAKLTVFEQTDVDSSEFHRGGQFLVMTPGDGTTINVLDSVTCQTIGSPLTHSNKFTFADISANGEVVIGKDSTNFMACWDTSSGEMLREFVHEEMSPGGTVSGLLDPTGRRVATLTANQVLRLWNSRGDTPAIELGRFTETNEVTYLEFSSDGELLLACLKNQGSVRIWRVDSGERIIDLDEHPKSPIHARFFPRLENGADVAVVISSGNSARCWSLEGEALAPPLVHQEDVGAATISLDGRRVVTASKRFVQVWDMATAEPLTAAIELAKPLRWVQLNHNGEQLLTVFGERVHLHDLNPRDRSVEELATQVDVLACRGLDNTETLGALDFKKFHQQWLAFCTHEDNSTDRSDEAMRRWHSDVAVDCRDRSQDFATAFHLIRSAEGGKLDERSRKLLYEMHISRGSEFHDNQNYRRAIVEYTKAIEFDDTASFVYTSRADSRRRLGEHDKAIEDLHKSLELDSSYARAHHLLGYTYEVNKKDYAVAVEHYTDAIALDQTKANYFRDRGDANRHLKKYDEALADYGRALALDSTYANAFGGRALVFAAQKQYADAAEEYGKAIALASEEAAYYIYRGDAYRGMKEQDRAIEDYTMAIRLNPDIANAYNGRGTIYDDRQDYERAVTDFSAAIERDPTSALYYRNRALMYSHLEKHKEAIDDFSEAIRLDPSNSVNFLSRGNIYHDKFADYKRAIADYDSAIAIEPRASRFTNRANSHSQLGETEKALADYAKAIEFDPAYAIAYRGRALMYRKLERHMEAIADFNEAIRLDPSDSLNFLSRGNIYHDKFADYKRAIADYDSAIAIEPRASRFTNRANSYSQLGETEKALADFNKAIEFDPAYALAYRKRALLYSKLEKHKEAIADFSEAIRLNPSDSSNFLSRGNIYHNEFGDYNLAIADYDSAIVLEPSALLFTNRAGSYLQLGEKEKALADFNKAIESDPTYVTAFKKRADFYQNQLGEYENAIADYTKAIELDPDNASIYHDRGTIYHNNFRDYKRAIADYDSAIMLEPSVLLFTNRANSYSKLGDTEKALADYAKAIKLDPDSALTYNNMAWLLATYPNAEVRNGKKAVEHATKACELTEWKNPFYLDSLAAAYAEGGDFAAAVKWAKSSAEFAEDLGDELKNVQARIKLYESEQPFHEVRTP